MQEWFEGGHEAEEREEEARWFPDLGGHVREPARMACSEPVGVNRQGCVHAGCSTCGRSVEDGSCECEWTCACGECRAARA
jgi:hypothetical protein